jgi:hypothetical protein
MRRLTQNQPLLDKKSMAVSDGIELDWAGTPRSMSDRETACHYASQGPLGQVVLDGRVSDRNVQHVRGGYGVDRLERKAKVANGDSWAFLIL